jgi:uncharacterized protein
MSGMAAESGLNPSFQVVRGRFVFERHGEYVLLDPVSLESVLLTNEEYQAFECAGEIGRPIDAFLSDANCIDRGSLTRDQALSEIFQRLQALSLPSHATRISGYRVVLTDKCNLKCRYCFVETNSGKADLSLEDLTEGLRFLFAHNEKQDEVTIQWFGGEPTLRFDLIAYGDELINQLQKRYTIRTVQRTIVTNGVKLDDRMLDHFERHRYGIGFSVDGPELINHQERTLLGGQNYFSKLRENIARAIGREGISVGANLTPTVRNVEMLPDIVEYIIRDLGIKFIYVNDPLPARGHEKIDGRALARQLGKSRLRALSLGGVMHSIVDRVYQSLDSRIPRILEEIDGSLTAALLPGGMVSLSDLFWGNPQLWIPVSKISHEQLNLQNGSKELLPVGKCMRCPAMAICGGPPVSHAYFAGKVEPDAEHCRMYHGMVEEAVWDTLGLQ